MYRKYKNHQSVCTSQTTLNKGTTYPSLADLTPNVIPVLHRNALSHMIDLIDPYQPFRKLKHVISQTDDDELRILRPLLNVRSDN